MSASASSPLDARYSRQVRVPAIGEQGQARLGRSRVLIVGVGATGSHAAELLCRAGIGQLWLVDRDVVEHTNLQRQILYTEEDARDGTPKALAACRHLGAINSLCEVTGHVADCSPAFLDGLPAVPDLVLDGTDNFPTRYVLNDWCARHEVPWIYAGAVGTEGASMVVRPGGPCLRCLWPEPPAAGDAATCETAGILAPTIAAVSAFQTAEALKILVGTAPSSGVFTCDVIAGIYQRLGSGRGPSPDCPVCSGAAYPALEGPGPSVVTLCGRDAVQIAPPREVPIELGLLADRLEGAVQDLARTPHLLRFTADGCRFSVFPGGRALLFGIADPLRAQALYDRWIGAR